MIDTLLKKHIDFWDGVNNEPLRALLSHPGWSRRPYPLTGNRYAVDPVRIGPDDVDVDKLLGAERLPSLAHIGDYILGVKTIFPVTCMESLIGCPVYAADTSCYAKPFDSVSTEETSENDWIRVLDSVLRREVELAGDRLPALQLHLRGVVDMVAAYWGEERMCLTMFDDPAAIHLIVEDFAHRFIRMARRGIEMRPKWKNGYVSHWGVFSPDPVLDYQVDATSILSREQYNEFFLEADRSILSGFTRSVVHLHACGLHIAPSIAPLSNSRAVEISLDREAGAFEIDEIIDVSRELQENNVRVILHGELVDTEADSIAGALDPGGLAIFYWNPKAPE